MNYLHGDAVKRKQAPMAEGLLWYFPDALAAVAAVSKIGNDQHNPGQSMHWSRGKSSDHADCIMRHLALAGTLDKDGVPETAKVAWRALALLQEECEREFNLPLPRNARFDEVTNKEINERQVSTNPLPASNQQEPLLPMEGRSGQERDMGRDCGSVHAECCATEDHRRAPIC